MNKRKLLGHNEIAEAFELKMSMLRARNKVTLEISDRLSTKMLVEQIDKDEPVFTFSQIRSIYFNSPYLTIRRQIVRNIVRVSQSFETNRIVPRFPKVDATEYLDELDELLNHTTETGSNVLNEVATSLELVQVGLGEIEQKHVDTQELDNYLNELGLHTEEMETLFLFKGHESVVLKFEYEGGSAGLILQNCRKWLDMLCSFYERPGPRCVKWIDSPMPGTTLSFHDRELSIQDHFDVPVVIGSRTCGTYELDISNTFGVAVGFSLSPVPIQSDYGLTSPPYPAMSGDIPWVIYYHLASGSIWIRAPHACPEQEIKDVDPFFGKKAHIVAKRNDSGSILFTLTDDDDHDTILETCVEIKVPFDTPLYPIAKIDPGYDCRTLCFC